MADEKEPLKPRSYWHAALKSIGLVHCHDWRESHGNGGQETWQAPFNMVYGDRTDVSVPAFTLCYNREGFVTGLMQRSENRDYLKALEINGRGHDTGDYLEYGKPYTSQCATSGSFKVVEYDNHGRDETMGWHVFGAAGHPDHASWEKQGYNPLILKRFYPARRAWDDAIDSSDFREVDNLYETRWVEVSADVWTRTFQHDRKSYRFTLTFEPGEKRVAFGKLEEYTRPGW